MEETFTITVLDNNQQRDFECTFQAFGYTHKITVPVNETIIHFEPDEKETIGLFCHLAKYLPNNQITICFMRLQKN